MALIDCSRCRSAFGNQGGFNIRRATQCSSARAEPLPSPASSCYIAPVSTDNDLFPPAPLLSWLPDEILFSLVSRHHLLWGHTVASRTSEQFFGHALAGTHHDLPNRLQTFAERTQSVYGDAREIAEAHTLLRFYKPFIASTEFDNAVHCMAGNSVAHLKLRLGILTSRFRANHPLKACPKCMDEDLETQGWSYWHLSHQYPGVWVCAKHKEPLLQSTLKSSGVQRFQWVLPRIYELQSGWTSRTMNSQADLSSLLSFGALVDRIVFEGVTSPLASRRLYEIYRAELQSRDWISPRGSLRLTLITASFLEHIRPFQGLDEFAGLPQSVQAATAQLGRLLRPPRSGTHPLRHIILIHWLFKSWETFKRALEQHLDGDDVVVETSTPPVAPGVNDPRRKALHQLIGAGGLSISAAAAKIGIDTCTAMAWAAKLGIAVQRRPKKLTPAVRAQTINKLRRGADKAEAAKFAGVSIQSITRLLLTEVGLHGAWTQAREARARKHARRVWGNLCESSGGLGIKWMRSVEPAVFAWLYRNDRAWLDENKPAQLPLTSPFNGTSVDWMARDEALSDAVRKTALQLLSEEGHHRVFFWQLYQRIPELKAKRSSLHRLPRTQQAIAVALSSLPATGDDLFA